MFPLQEDLLRRQLLQWTLMNSEVRMLLEHRQNQDGQEDMELSDVFQKTLDYCKVNFFRYFYILINLF